MLTEPRRPILTMSPSRASEVGSPIRIMSGRMPRSAIQSMIARRAVGGRAFLVAGDDQAERARMIGDVGAGGDEGGDRRPSCRPRRGRRAGRRGSRARTGRSPSPRPAAPRRDGRRSRNAARRCRASRTDSRPARPAPRRRRSGGPSKPSGVSAASSTSNTAPVAGVTLGQAISRAARSTGSIAALMRAA